MSKPSVFSSRKQEGIPQEILNQFEERERFLSSTFPRQAEVFREEKGGLRVFYADKKDESQVIKGKITSIVGVNSAPLSDEARVLLDEKGNPAGIIGLNSSDDLEEDVAGMELEGKYILSPEERIKVVNLAIFDLLTEIGPYIPKARLERLFPGLDLVRLSEYNFANSKIKIYILPSLDAGRLYRAANEDNQYQSLPGAVAFKQVSTESHPLVGNVIKVNLGEKRLVIISEWDPNNPYIGPVPAEERVVRMVERVLRITVIHELLHTLEVGDGLPRRMQEGVVEWYARWIAVGPVSDEDFYLNRGFFYSYHGENEAIAFLFIGLMEEGVDIDVIDEAFVTHDQEARIKIEGALIRRYGFADAERIMKWDYASSREALSHIASLEARKNSEFGEFIRTFGDKELIKP